MIKPPRPAPKDDLFPLIENAPIIKSNELPIQRQRRQDGTPINTRPGRLAHRPQGAPIYLEGLKKSVKEEKKSAPLNPDDVVKSFLNGK